MKQVFKTQGVCSQAIAIDLDENTGIINEVQFAGGCHGNTQGVAALAKGQKAEDVISRLQGIKCGAKNTSCPDQLACALAQMIK